MKLEGVYSVLPTPFTATGDVDLESLKRIVDLFIGAGVSGLTALGVTSEVARMNDGERKQILETVVRHANRRVRVVAGATADGVRTCIDYTRFARDTGADAVMISPPRAPKLNSDAVVRHFAAVAAAVEIPIVIQDFPPVSGFTMEPALLVRIAREVPAANTIKLEDPPTPFKTSRIREVAQGLEVGVFGGLGGVFLLEELMAGATGAMTGFAYPEILVKIVKLFHSGDLDAAAEAFYPFVPLMRFEFQEGLGMAIRKEVLRRRGVIECADIRLPGAKLDAATSAALDRVLAWTLKK
ncbi:MAG: dihydrodipicolinate synthase family protein [Candidatus Solibacter sp.]